MAIWKKRCRTSSIFLVGAKECNKKRQHLINMMSLVLDELTSGWWLKTLKLGSLTNCAYETWNAIHLGPIFKNGLMS